MDPDKIYESKDFKKPLRKLNFFPQIEEQKWQKPENELEADVTNNLSKPKNDLF